MGFNHNRLDIVEEYPGAHSENTRIPYASSVIADSSLPLVSYRTDASSSELAVVDTESVTREMALSNSKGGEMNFGFVNSESEQSVRRQSDSEVAGKNNVNTTEEANSETIRRNCLKDIRLRLLKDAAGSEKIREETFVKLFSKLVSTFQVSTLFFLV